MSLWNQGRGKIIPRRLRCAGWVPHSLDGVGGSFQLQQCMHNLKISPVNSQLLLVSPCTTKFSKTAPKRIICSQTSHSFLIGLLGKGVGVGFEHLWHAGVNGGCVNHGWWSMDKSSVSVSASAPYGVVSQMVTYLCRDPDSHSNNRFYLSVRSRLLLHLLPLGTAALPLHLTLTTDSILRARNTNLHC